MSLAEDKIQNISYWKERVDLPHLQMGGTVRFA